ncbi:DUF541 domain-containing protein [Methanocalculus taiwanensis]|uniref:DUF541 domain-containing protein n=1 Tax=Methanocalculus taiwanensis TaxID=106207 RepID=A0ABD4TKQ9_9EURY|nr:SIMPL domain-containing protein [Methanocalculus taiwanensis]MCQ1538877.1 DUF541 domain-containing protein [Methanocalculus taiwanensis]
MRKHILTPLLALLLVFSLIVLPVSAETTSNERVINTQGTGTITTTPDRVEISVAVMTEHADVRAAQRENAVKMNTVMNALKNAGITSDDIKTTGYSIYQVTKDGSSVFPTERQAQVYRVTNTLMITLKDTTKAGDIIDIAIENGANNVNYISFTLSDEKQASFRAEALKEAVAQSRSDADVVAASLGLSVRDVKEVTIGGGYYPTSARYDSMMYAAGMEKAATPIEAGEVTVSATVSITYLC